jgi:hypothetical protein
MHYVYARLSVVILLVFVLAKLTLCLFGVNPPICT